jgi:serine-type D-Ala-D-Ala carboxypeptidase/endopeptidase (penicillin-binding protein 4)
LPAVRLPRRLTAASLGALTLLLVLAPASPALDASAVRGSLARAVAAAGATHTSALAVDLTTGTTLYERGADARRIPASVEKLFTTATALRRYGPDARLATTVVLDGDLDAEGRLDGDLVLVGGGDPTLDRSGIARLARQVRDSGVRRVSGSVLGDESWLDSARGGPRTGGAYDSDMGGVLGALTLNRGWSARPGGPALAAARALVRSLRSRGVRVSGRTAVGRPSVATAPIAAIRSVTMDRLARAINVPSDNFAAEVLLKDLGAAFGRSGSTAQGAEVVRRTMDGLGVERRNVADGSGLSRANRVSARQVVGLLKAMRDTDEAEAFESSLAVAGRTGTLRKRLRGTAAAGACRGKTGTLNGVSSLAGLCSTRDGHTVAFALLMNGVAVWRAHLQQDRIATALASYRTSLVGKRVPSP